MVAEQDAIGAVRREQARMPIAMVSQQHGADAALEAPCQFYSLAEKLQDHRPDGVADFLRNNPHLRGARAPGCGSDVRDRGLLAHLPASEQSMLVDEQSCQLRCCFLRR